MRRQEVAARKGALALGMVLAMSLTLAACGGNGGGSAGSTGASGTAGGDAPVETVRKGNNWSSADDVRDIVENDYGFDDVEVLSNMDDENDKTYRMTTWREDELVEHFIDISFDGTTNEITGLNWYYETHSSDLDYWMETLGLVITDSDDQQIIRDLLSDVDLSTFEESELSDAKLTVNCFGDEEYATLNVCIVRK